MRNLYPPASSHGNAAAAAAAAQHARAAAAASYYSHTNNLSHHMSRYPQVGKGHNKVFIYQVIVLNVTMFR